MSDLLPTPRKNRRGLPDSHGRPFAEMLPTPTRQSYGSNNGGGAGRAPETKRPSVMGMLSTPTTIMNHDAPSMVAKHPGSANFAAALSQTLGDRRGSIALASIYGPMMGYPPEWLAAPLKLLAMQSSPKSPSPSRARSSKSKAAQAVGSRKADPPAPKRRGRGGGEMSSHSHAERGHDLYQTPPIATRALLLVEPSLKAPRTIWEPACGPGAIVRELRAAGHTVHATDLVDYAARMEPDSRAGVDFLGEIEDPPRCELIVTNPPFKHADAFVRRALERAPRVVMLLRLGFLEGERRSDIIDRHLSRVWLGIERLPAMHRDGWEGKKLGNATVPFAWFVFDRRPRLPGHIEIRRMSWRDPSSAASAGMSR